MGLPVAQPGIDACKTECYLYHQALCVLDMSFAAILVEDSKIIRDNLIPALKDLADIEVIAIAETEDQAARALANHLEWRLAIVDLFLKEGIGLSVLRACQDRSPDQYVVVLTNYPNCEIRQRCLDLGADAVFDKSKEIENFFEQCLKYQLNKTSQP